MLRAAATASRGRRVDGELTLSVIRTRVAFVPSPTRRPARALLTKISRALTCNRGLSTHGPRRRRLSS